MIVAPDVYARLSPHRSTHTHLTPSRLHDVTSTPLPCCCDAAMTIFSARWASSLRPGPSQPRPTAVGKTKSHGTYLRARPPSLLFRAPRRRTRRRRARRSGQIDRQTPRRPAAQVVEALPLFDPLRVEPGSAVHYSTSSAGRPLARGASSRATPAWAAACARCVAAPLRAGGPRYRRCSKRRPAARRRERSRRRARPSRRRGRARKQLRRRGGCRS